MSQSATSNSYSGILRYAVNDLSETVLHEKLLPEFQPPRKYTGTYGPDNMFFLVTGLPYFPTIFGQEASFLTILVL